MKLKSLRFELATDDDTEVHLYVDADGEITKVDIMPGGTFWPEDLEAAAKFVTGTWNTIRKWATFHTSSAP